MGTDATSAKAGSGRASGGGKHVYRFEVRAGVISGDPIGAGIAREAKGLGVACERVEAVRVYLVESQGELDGGEREIIGSRLLADPVTEVVRECVRGVEGGSGGGQVVGKVQVVEVHPLPGVMDPVAESVELAIGDLIDRQVRVSSGWRYELGGVTKEGAALLAGKVLANGVIQRIVHGAGGGWGGYFPKEFAVGAVHKSEVREISITRLGDDELVKLSRDAHLFLSLDEMKAVQGHYRKIGREPRDIELETLAQTWSEHCVHKTLKSNVRYRVEGGAGDSIVWAGRPGVEVHGDGSVSIRNLLKSTVAGATFGLIERGVDWTLSVFKDNSGVIALNDEFGVCVKVETHNRPSAIEPYGGAATGAGGCIRDVIGTGLGAKPVANTNVFCVAPPGMTDLPPGTLSPRRILNAVVAGVRDYGNRMGIATVSGGVYFDERYVGNPLVFCGCIGLIPRGLVKGKVRAGDRIIAIGGKTGRDGIHGATFSSAQLEQNASDEFAHAVQIGNAITEKRVLDAILRARDFVHEGGRTEPLYSAMTDCGAGGFSSAVGEMGSELGAEVHLEKAPLKYAGLSYTEIWISEAQERMVLAVPGGNVERFAQICAEEGVDCADLGYFGTPGAELVLYFHGTEVGRMSMELLHDGIPMPTREAVWSGGVAVGRSAAKVASRSVHVKDALLGLLAHPNIASKHWIIRQYDHEVQGGSVIKPLVGVAQRGPSDASVIDPLANHKAYWHKDRPGVAISCGLQTGAGDVAIGGDPYQLALLGIDECVRNLVCVGADVDRIAILDNFCWPSCSKSSNMASLVRACVGCYDGAMAYGTPFVSGKDSLNNQLVYKDPSTGEQKTIEIPPTLLISGLSVVKHISTCVTMDAKEAGNVLMLVGPKDARLGGSHYQRMFGLTSGDDARVIGVDLKAGPVVARGVADVIGRGLVASAHDVSDGGVLCAVAEMLIGGSGPGRSIGATLDAKAMGQSAGDLFGEGPSRYLLEVGPGQLAEVAQRLKAAGIDAKEIGRVDASGMLRCDELKLSAVVGDLAGAWMGTLDW